MNDLHFYVAAIVDRDALVAIAKREITEEITEEITLDDNGEQLCTREQTVTFSNGVVVHQSVEQTFEHSLNEAVCAECWISYRVVHEPETMNITPKRKHFINTCQQSFWLSIRRMQQ
ncbi:hypothetical protein FNJ21_004354 [Vibrio fluvialis]|nr:hypothetical protein [Vibrio fluvialis]EKO3980663.1 hypothetical protein [Vibrio fluvialis]